MCREGPEGEKRHKESKVGTLKSESPTRYSEPPLDQVPYFLFAPCEDSEHPMYSLHPSPSSRPLPFLLAPRLVASPVLHTFPVLITHTSLRYRLHHASVASISLNPLRAWMYLSFPFDSPPPPCPFPPGPPPSSFPTRQPPPPRRPPPSRPVCFPLPPSRPPLPPLPGLPPPWPAGSSPASPLLGREGPCRVCARPCERALSAIHLALCMPLPALHDLPSL